MLRLPASTAVGGASSGSIQVLGVPAAALPSLRLAGDGFQPSDVAGSLAPAQPIATEGADIPAGPVSLPVTLRGAPVTLALIVQDAGGAVTSVPMGLVSEGGRCSTAPSRRRGGWWRSSSGSTRPAHAPRCTRAPRAARSRPPTARSSWAG